MSRLIDADVLLEHIKKLECHAENKKYEQGLNDCLQFYFPQIIDKQPTAYNIDVVVAELEKEKEIHTEHYNISLYKDYPEIKQRYEQIQGVIDKAIEIVRKGGA